MGHAKILVVEDDQALQEALCDTLAVSGYDTVPCCSGEQALECLHLQPDIDLVLSDVQMSPMDGLALLSAMRESLIQTPIILMTAYATVENAVQAVRLGATEYLQKPVEFDALIRCVKKTLGNTEPLKVDEMVVESPKMRELAEVAQRVSGTDASVLICGESGTGKEVMCRFIHAHSLRSEGPFVAINCAAIPENMLEAMLFGYEKGAFTGALKTTQGKFEQAQGGTLLLDEISEMELGLQAKLLRVIQEREVERLGGREIIALDVRILATTNRNLREAVANGKFREDLFYRLNVFPLHLPALRERVEDIGPLAERLLARHAAAEEMARTFSHDALKKLAMHPWRGNVRELDNVIQRALILAQGAEILPCDIRFEEETAVNDPVADDDQSMLQSDLRSREYEMIIKALVSANGSRKQAADTLGISARTLRYKLSRMREQGITVPGVNGEAREMAVPTVESL